MKTIENIIYLEDRSMNRTRDIFHIIERMGWIHYPTNYTGEELEKIEVEGADDSLEETVEVPESDIEMWDILVEVLSEYQKTLDK